MNASNIIPALAGRRNAPATQIRRRVGERRGSAGRRKLGCGNVRRLRRRDGVEGVEGVDGQRRASQPNGEHGDNDQRASALRKSGKCV